MSFTPISGTPWRRRCPRIPVDLGHSEQLAQWHTMAAERVDQPERAEHRADQPPERPIRWGIVSTGHIAGVFCSDLALLPDHEIAAVGSRDAARAREFAEQHAIPRCYGSYGELLDDGGVDVVYVATPHSEHYETVRQFLQAGTPVLCEKPFTANARQATELVELARSVGVFCMEAMWMWCNPVQRHLYASVADGAIGQVRALQADLGFTAEYDPNGRLFAPELAGGALLDVGVYPVAFTYRLLGMPELIQVHGRLADTGVDTTVAVTFGYSSGAVAQLMASFDTELPQQARVSGTRGWIELPSEFQIAPHYTVHRPDRAADGFAEEAIGGGYVYEAQEVARCLRAGWTESPWVPLDDTLAVMTLLDRIRGQLGVQYPFD